MASGDLIVEVADKETLDQAYENTLVAIEAIKLKNIKRYGLKIDKNDSNPETRCTYIFDAEGMKPASMNFTTGVFDYGDWKNVFFVKNNYPAMVKYDGTEEYKLDPENYAYKTDGTASDISNTEYEGNAMSVFDGTVDGKIWLSQYEDEKYEYMIVSNMQYDKTYNDFAYVRKDGTHGEKLYYPMFGGSFDGTRLRSLAGKELMVNTNRSEEIRRAEANGPDWNIGSWSRRNLLNCLIKIISKTDDGKTAFGMGAIGGSIPKTGTLVDKGQFFGYEDTAHDVKVFHVEKWWGGRSDAINGMILNSGKLFVKMTPPYNINGTNYEDTGMEVPNNISGWAKKTQSSQYGRYPISNGGSSSTYLCSYYRWGYNNQKKIMPIVGGGASGGNWCGVDYMDIAETIDIKSYETGASVYIE